MTRTQWKATAARWTASVRSTIRIAKAKRGARRRTSPPTVTYPATEVEPYFDMARQYAFADRMFETNEGPSFPAHQYLISGTSTISQGSTLRAAENPITADQKFTGGCDSPKGSLALLIDQNGEEVQETYPCYDRPTLMDLITAKGLTWRYYEWKTGPGLWNAPDAILHLQEGSQFSTEVVATAVEGARRYLKWKFAHALYGLRRRQRPPITRLLPTARGRPGSPRSLTLSARAPIGTTPRSS